MPALFVYGRLTDGYCAEVFRRSRQKDIGEEKAADRLEKAVAAVIQEGKFVTYDMKADRNDPSVPESLTALAADFTLHGLAAHASVAPDKGRFLDLDNLPEFRKAHPRIAILADERKRDKLIRDFPGFREVGSDLGHVLFVSPETP